MQGIGPRVGSAPKPIDDGSSLRVLMFSDLAHLSRDEVEHWLEQQDANAESAGVMDLHCDTDLPAFTAAIARIHEAIRAGETYQVNYSYRLH